MGGPAGQRGIQCLGESEAPSSRPEARRICVDKPSSWAHAPVALKCVLLLLGQDVAIAHASCCGWSNARGLAVHSPQSGPRQRAAGAGPAASRDGVAGLHLDVHDWCCNSHVRLGLNPMHEPQFPMQLGYTQECSKAHHVVLRRTERLHAAEWGGMANKAKAWGGRASC